MELANEKNDGTVGFTSNLRCGKIYERQQPSTIDFTEVRCKNKIDQPCTMAPGSTWQKWSTAKRIELVTGESVGNLAWCYLLLVDDEETIRIFNDKIGEFDTEDYGQILKIGQGETPPSEVKQWLKEHYLIDYDYQTPANSSN